MSTTVEDEGFAAHRKRVLIGNLRASQLRRLAVHRREHGIPIDWEAFGFAIAKALRPGELSRKRPPPTAEDALLGGMKHRLATAMEEFTPEIVDAVQIGVDRANSTRWDGFIGYDDGTAKRLAITMDEAEILRLYHLPTADLSPEQRAQLTNEKRRARQRARRKAQSRDDYENSSMRAQAERMGIKPATLRKRRSRARIAATRTIA